MGGWVGGAGWGAGCVLLALCFLECKLRCLDQNFETNGGGAGGEGPRPVLADQTQAGLVNL